MFCIFSLIVFLSIVVYDAECFRCIGFELSNARIFSYEKKLTLSKLNLKENPLKLKKDSISRSLLFHALIERSFNENFYLSDLIIQSSDVSEGTVSILPPWFPSFATACLGGLLFGLDIGSSSSVLRILGTGLSEFGNLDPIQLGQIASSSLLGAIISSASIILIGDKVIGRKNELQIG